MKKVWYMMKFGRKHTQGFCIRPDYWRGQAPLLKYWGGQWPPGPPGSYSTAIRLHLYFAVAYPIVNEKYTRVRNSISSVQSRIHHRKLCDAIKMQSDWSRLIQGAGTTRCIALYQTLPLPRRKSLAMRD